MLNPMAFYNSRPDGIGVLEVVGRGREPRLFVPLKRSALQGEVSGPLAALRLTQVYGYTAEACDKVLEAVYRFPLPGDAAVTGVRVRFGEVEICAEIKPRAQAEADYTQARREGRQAALVTREAPDVFTLQVAGIKPGEDVVVETAFVQLARAEGVGWALRVPLTTAPRYVRSDEHSSRHAGGQPLALLRDPGHRFSLDLRFAGAAAVESATHALDTTVDEEGLRVRLQGGEIVPDSDCVLSWRPRQDEARTTLQVYTHDDAEAGQLYFLAQVAPPAAPAPEARLPREVIVLVDHSGSMDGAKWEAADWAVIKFLSELAEGDAFNLGLFHNETRWFAEWPQQANKAVVEQAVRFLKAHRDSGGTELGVALEQALAMARSEGARSRHVLVITDAQVSDDGRILRLADEEAAQPARRRISVLCIDAAPNAFLARQLAERGGGLARFLTSAPEEEDITTALDAVLADWAQPVLAGLRLEVDRPGLLAAGHAPAGGGAVDLGDLPAGRTLWVAGRAARAEGGAAGFRLVAGGREVAACTVEPAGKLRPAVKALFGAWRVNGIEYLIGSDCDGAALADGLVRLGYALDEVLAAPGGKPRVYAENRRRDTEQALRRLLVHEALDYGLASAETGFVAVRKERGEAVEGTVLVANALPRGWSGEPLPPPGVRPAMTLGRLDSIECFAAPLSVRRAGDADDVASTAAPLLEREAPQAYAGEAVDAAPRGPEAVVVFCGAPAGAGGEALLFDSDRRQDAGRLHDLVILSRLVVRFVAGTPAPEDLDPGLTLRIYVDDMAAPRASVRLADLVRQGGERPLHIARRAKARVRIVLVDPAGAWQAAAPEIEVTLLTL